MSLVILCTGAYGNTKVDEREQVTTEEEPSFDTSSGRDDDLSSLTAHDDDGTKNVAYNAVAMGSQLKYKRLE